MTTLADPGRRLGVTWQLSTRHGWGVFGLNLVLELAHRGHPPLLLAPPEDDGLPAELAQSLLPLVDEYEQTMSKVITAGGGAKLPDVTILHSLGNGFTRSAHGRLVSGGADVGFVFFEDPRFDDAALERARPFARILAGSSWNRDVLSGLGLDCRYTPQGIDTQLFRPGPRQGVPSGKFVVFSGGKLEPRKGQDLVLAAFKAFHQRHPNSLLVTAWQNSWPETAAGIAASPHVDDVPATRGDGTLDIAAWAVANGVPADAFVDLGWIPNWRLPDILREIDVAVFPNRCEGGTNLAAMEAMACGVPCILAANSGHLDIIADGNCLALQTQSPCPASFAAPEAWRESSIEEIISALDAFHDERHRAVAVGRAGAEFMESWSWRNQVSRMVEAVSDLV